MSCCPIEVGEFKESESIPEDSSHECKQACEAVGPVALEGDESEENVKE